LWRRYFITAYHNSTVGCIIYIGRWDAELGSLCSQYVTVGIVRLVHLSLTVTFGLLWQLNNVVNDGDYGCSR